VGCGKTEKYPNILYLTIFKRCQKDKDEGNSDCKKPHPTKSWWYVKADKECKVNPNFVFKNKIKLLFIFKVIRVQRVWWKY